MSINISKRKKGFTLLELLVTIVILGILATLGITQYVSAKEKALNKEAIAIAKLVRAAELAYKYENGQYIECSDVSDCNDKLKLSLPTGTKRNWDVEVTVDAGPFFIFAAQISRNITNMPSGYGRYYLIGPSSENPQCYGKCP